MFGLLGVILGAAAIVLALRRGAEAAPPEVYVPTAEEIYAAQSIAKLEAYYDMINELYLSGVIDYNTYTALYTVYETRFNELIGAV